MTYYLVDTYHGPLILVQRATDWIIASPYRSVEIYDGRISESCLESARPISERGAREIVPDLPGEPTLKRGSLDLGNLERGNAAPTADAGVGAGI